MQRNSRTRINMIGRSGPSVTDTGSTVTVHLRSKIPGLTLDARQSTCKLNPRLPWAPQLGLLGVDVNTADHCIRRGSFRGAAGRWLFFPLDQAVRNFQQSFSRRNIRTFVAILTLKQKPPVTLRRIAASATANVSFTSLNQQNGSPRTNSPRTNTRIQNTAVRVSPQYLNEATLLTLDGSTLLPRIFNSVNRSRQTRLATPDPALGAARAPVPRRAQNGHPQAVNANIQRGADTQDGDLRMDQKNTCIAYIEQHWNNKDIKQILAEVQKLKRSEHFRTFRRLLPFTSGFLEQYALIGGPFNEPDQAAATGQRLNLRDEDTQGGDTEGIDEKTRWLDHVRERWNNQDIIDIRDELAQLIQEDKYRGFLRLLSFTAGFIKETFHDILV